MFPKAENPQPKNPVAKDENVRKEAELEKGLSSGNSAGNEAANVELMDQMLKDANNDNVLDLSGEIPNDEMPGGIGSGRNSSFMEPGADDPDNSMYLNSSHNIVNENNFRSGRNKKGRYLDSSANIVNDNNIIRNDTGSDISLDDGLNIISTKDESKRKKKPSKADEKKALDLAEKIVQEQKPKIDEDFAPLSTYALDEDLIVETGNKKRGKKKKGKKSPKHQNIIDPPKSKIEGLENLDEDARWKHEAGKRLKKVELADEDEAEQAKFHAEEMEKLKNWNFDAVKLKDVKKSSVWRKIGAYTAWGMGKILGTALQIVTLGHYRRAKAAARFTLSNHNKWQTVKDNQSIPGWDGAKYKSKDNDVIADFRRVPTVWSQLTASKAADTVKKGDEEEEKPLDPIVSINIEQPKSGSAQSMTGREIGHAFIGIEYSRWSAVSNRYERYKLEYGFYPAGSFSNVSSSMRQLLHNATVPGQLADDTGHQYDVSRRYPAKPEQVSAILNASEKYAEGGYSFYNRNCTTFVKQMIVDTAHLATGGDIFKQSEVEYSHLVNLGMFGASAFDSNSKAGVENTLMDLAKQDDQTYQNYGNKRVTKKDMVNYFESQKKSGHITNKTFIPGETAERMRRMQGDGTGQISSYKFSDPLKDDDGDVTVGLSKIDEAITSYGETIKGKLSEIFPEETWAQLPFEVTTFMNSLSGFGTPLYQLNMKIDNRLAQENAGKSEENKIQRQDAIEQFYINADELRSARQELSENIEKVNILLNNYLKNDARVHQDLLNLTSLLNYGINYVDKLYRLSSRSGDNIRNITNTREKLNLSTITVRADGNEANFTPTHYESYIQIYKDPKTAVEKYARLKKLREKKKASTWTHGFMNIQGRKLKSKFGMEDDDQITYDEAIELRKLERIEELALDFDNAHKYMAEKDTYSQQDIDYAFRLHDKETKGLQTRNEVPHGQEDVNIDVRDEYKSASGIYITIFMEKFFKDIKDLWMKEENEGGISEAGAKDPAAAGTWLDDYLTSHIKQKEKGFQMIVRGLYRSIKAADPDKKITGKMVMEKLIEVLQQTVINNSFPAVGGDPKLAYAAINLSIALSNMSQNRSKFNGIVKTMTRVCQMEEEDKNLTVMNKKPR